jgi:peroxiredoxin Q/BCP
MLKVGDVAPEFSVEATNGKPVSLKALRGRPVVLYFFPKAFTMGCTFETRQFRDSYEELRTLGAEIVGISSDRFDEQCKFAIDNNLPFPLISDPEKRICDAFGVLWPLIRLPQRTTFVIDEQGVIQAVFHHEVQISRHLDDVRRFLERRRPLAT